MKATITERGQISIPTQLRREMHLEPGQSVQWEKVSDTECRLTMIPKEEPKPDAVAALNFAREHGLDGGSTDEWMKLLRAGEEE